MRFIVPAMLLGVAFIHALPLVGVLGADRLSRLYGITVQDPNLTLLLRHRAVLFGALAALLAIAAFRPEWHRLGLVAGLVSVVSFLVLAAGTGPLTPGLVTVVRADVLALGLLLVGVLVHAVHPTPVR